MPDPKDVFARSGFDAATAARLRDAYDIARKALHDKGQPELVLEVMAGHIVALAKTGERDPQRLADAALAPLQPQSFLPRPAPVRGAGRK